MLGWHALLVLAIDSFHTPALGSFAPEAADLGSHFRILGASDSGWEAATEKVCEGKETQTATCPPQLPCKPCMPWDCTFAAWSSWSTPSGFGKEECTGLCMRSRIVSHPGSECGKRCQGPVKEFKACQDKPSCYLPPVDCQVSQWSMWTVCAKATGQSTRMRSILSEANVKGTPCSGSMSESKICGSYQPKNCTLAAWSAWTPCSVTCGEGTSIRTRHVANHADIFGQTCKGTLSEEKICSIQTCVNKRDCSMGTWAPWSTCELSASERARDVGTSYGQRSRTRPLNASVADGAGCTGSTKETEGCNTYVALPGDCQLSLWTMWSQCSKTCGGGQTQRQRAIIKPASHGGSCPGADTAEAMGCNMQPCGVPANDCQLGKWSEWQACPVTCGKSQSSRFRVVTEAATGGKPCPGGGLTEVKPCGGASCAKKDCLWSAWSMWTTCSKSCGGGMMQRFRNISAMPEHGGSCLPNLRRVTAACATQDCPKVCVNGTWGQWSAWTPCSATCGRGYMYRNRAMATAPNTCGFPAIGVKDEFAACTQIAPGCHLYPDLDCKLSPWSMWSVCSGSCSGVNSRQRVVQVYAHGKGKSCEESPLKEFKQCAKSHVQACSGQAPKVDCNFTAWVSYAPCTVSCGGGTITKTRSVLPSKHGGEACVGGLSRLEACNTQLCPNSQCVDCRWSQWTEWDMCTTCEGQRSRRREIQQIGNFCGKRCDAASAVETTSCHGAVACPDALYCSWTEWSAFSACPLNTCGSHQTARERTLKKATGNVPDSSALVKARVGDPLTCTGRQEEMSFCSNTACTGCTPQDCKLSQWATWAAWNAGADTGLCRRDRSVLTFNNECGAPCKGVLIDTKSCPVQRVSVDCQMGGWSTWSHCTEQRSGQRYRERHVERESSYGGKPCSGELKETTPCDPQWHAPQNCTASSWSEWSTCTAQCLGGTQERTRNIIAAVVWPGKPCKIDTQQLRECNTENCDAAAAMRDCTFAAWGLWSTTCTGQNQRFRDRSIVGATNGGKECRGDLQETKACASGAVDCHVASWTDWSRCDTSCGVGRRERTRQVHRWPQNGGKACPGNLVELSVCNEDKPCEAKVDCEVGDWKPWTPCTVTCGSGQTMRKRVVTRKRSLAGVGCTQAMSETKPCFKVLGSQPTCIHGCRWGDWSDWSACSTKKNGMRTRNRGILRAPTVGGKKCDANTEEEVSKCNTGFTKTCTDGKWASWTSWGPCSVTCGDGFRWRTRVVATQASKCGKPAVGPSKETERCGKTTVGCVASTDCVFSNWTAWGACSATANGVQVRHRYIATYPTGQGLQCQGPLRQIEPCNIVAPVAPSPCQFGLWTSWSNCSATCGGGQQTRSRNITHHRGCTGPLLETVSCATQLCHKPVDCEWESWNHWGSCDVCAGIRHRDRQIKTQGLYGGKVCDSGFAQETAKCPRDCHGKYLCAWAEWSAWSSCSATCGNNGKLTRSRLLQLVNSSSAISRLYSDDLEDKVSELYRKSQRVESQRMHNMAVAFFSGVASLVVLAFALTPRRRQNTSREMQADEGSDRRVKAGLRQVWL